MKKSLKKFYIGNKSQKQLISICKEYNLKFIDNNDLINKAAKLLQNEAIEDVKKSDNYEKIIKIDKDILTKGEIYNSFILYNNQRYDFDNNLEYKSTELNQNLILKKMNGKKIKNDLKTNIILGFLHAVYYDTLFEILSCSQKLEIFEFFQQFDCIKAHYMRIISNKKDILREHGFGNIYLFFNSSLANDYNYYINKSTQYGYIYNDTIFKFDNYNDLAPVEYAVKIKKYNKEYSEILFFGKSISFKKYLKYIIFLNSKYLYFFKQIYKNNDFEKYYITLNDFVKLKKDNI